MPKMEVPQEDIDVIMELYERLGTYAATQRSFPKYSITIITRVIKEELEKEKIRKELEKTIPYHGPQPDKFPIRKKVLNSFCPTEEWWEEYDRIL